MLQDLLLKKRDAIVKKWLGLIAETLPSGASFLKNTDRFTNPVGYIFSSEVEVLYDELLRGLADIQKVSCSLENIIKVKAVQDFTAGEAVSFVFLLKKAMRDVIGKEIKGNQDLQQELIKLESQIDEMAMLGFEEYTICREKLNLIRVNEIKRDRDNARKMLERTTEKYMKFKDPIVNGYTTNEVTE
jgi:hypothetical protein